MTRRQKLQRLLDRKRKARPPNEAALQLELVSLLVAEQERKITDMETYHVGQLGATLGLRVTTPCEEEHDASLRRSVLDYLARTFLPYIHGAMICHRCDNEKCVTLEHLFLGTARDNVRDAILKDRYSNRRPHKELLEHARHKLTELRDRQSRLLRSSSI